MSLISWMRPVVIRIKVLNFVINRRQFETGSERANVSTSTSAGGIKIAFDVHGRFVSD